jgi:hypothetical protein
LKYSNEAPFDAALAGQSNDIDGVWPRNKIRSVIGGWQAAAVGSGTDRTQTTNNTIKKAKKRRSRQRGRLELVSRIVSFGTHAANEETASGGRRQMEMRLFLLLQPTTGRRESTRLISFSFLVLC